MLHLKDLWEGIGNGRHTPSLPLFLKRYDSKRVKGWGSANDMIPWELPPLNGRAFRVRLENESRVRLNWRLAITQHITTRVQYLSMSF